MSPPAIWAALGLLAFAGLVVVAAALLTGWRDWLALQRLVLEGRGGGATPAQRIELADLRERVRKLEAIAAGVDL